MFLIKQGGGGKVRKMVVVPKCANVCTGTYSLRKRECRAAGIMSRGACVRVCVSGWWALSRQLSGMQESLGATGSH